MTSATDVPPEIPAPGPPPQRPHRVPEPPVPVVAPSTMFRFDEPATDPRAALLRQRRVLLTGVLDDDAITRVSAELMMLDGESGKPVEIVVNSDGGPLLAIPALLDVIDLLRAPVATSCIGRAMGTAAVVLASGGDGRRAAGHAMIGLRLADEHDVSGRAHEIERFVEQVEHARERVVERLARITGLDRRAVVGEVDDGQPMTAQAARARGLIDEVSAR